MARLTVMFKESQYTPIKRDTLYSNAEIIALIGGLLALFFGASLLSGVELLYVLVWRRFGSEQHLHRQIEMEHTLDPATIIGKNNDDHAWPPQETLSHRTDSGPRSCSSE